MVIYVRKAGCCKLEVQDLGQEAYDTYDTDLERLREFPVEATPIDGLLCVFHFIQTARTFVLVARAPKVIIRGTRPPITSSKAKYSTVFKG